MTEDDQAEIHSTERGPGSRDEPQLPERTQRLLTSLEGRGRAKAFFVDARQILAEQTSPIAIRLAAYALREVIEELEKDPVASKRGRPLGNLVKDLSQEWTAVPREDDGALSDPGDPIIGCLDEFFENFAAMKSVPSDRAQEAIEGLDPVRRPGPPEVRQRRIRALLGYRKTFNHVLHGSSGTDIAHFRREVDSFEAFLLALLRPQTHEDLNSIEKFIAEGPPGG